MLVYKRLKLFETFGKTCDVCKCRPKWRLYFNNEKTDFVFLCEECLRTQQGKRVPPEDMQEFVLKVKTVGIGIFEVV